MKRFLKLFFIVTLVFTLGIGLAGCDNVSKDDYDKVVSERDEALSRIADLEERLAAAIDLPYSFKLTFPDDAELVNEVLQLERSETMQVDAFFEFTDDDDNAFPIKVNSLVEWSTDEPEYLKIDAAGMITAFAEGNYSITGTLKFDTSIKKTANIKVTDPTVVDDTDKVKIVVGVPKMNGLFINGFGNSAYDVSIRNLIHGYSTLWTTPGEQFIWDIEAVLLDLPEVEDVEPGEDKPYTFELQHDLKWNDGTSITAKDYLFNLLFFAGNEWKAQGATSTIGDQLVGYAAYRAEDSEPAIGEGSTPYFKGAFLDPDNEYKFTLVADGESLPYFYEMTMVALSPFPIHYVNTKVAEDLGEEAKIEVHSDENGAYLTGLLKEHAEFVAKK